MYKSVISLSKIINHIWHDHPFSQRNQGTKRALGLKVEAEDGGRGGNTAVLSGKMFALKDNLSDELFL